MQIPYPISLLLYFIFLDIYAEFLYLTTITYDHIHKVFKNVIHVKAKKYGSKLKLIP